MNKENVLNEISKQCYIYKNRRYFYNKLYKIINSYSHLVWNYYNPDDTIIKHDGNIIHHKDEDTMNDNISNLEKLSSSYHTTIHKLGSNNSNYGNKLSKEHRNKISKTLINKGLIKGKNNPMYGVRKFGKDNSMFGVRKYGKDNPNWKGGISAKTQKEEK